MRSKYKLKSKKGYSLLETVAVFTFIAGATVGIGQLGQALMKDTAQAGVDMAEEQIGGALEQTVSAQHFEFENSNKH